MTFGAQADSGGTEAHVQRNRALYEQRGEITLGGPMRRLLGE